MPEAAKGEVLEPAPSVGNPKKEVLATVGNGIVGALAALGFSNVTPVSVGNSVGNTGDGIANTPETANTSNRMRREWRINAKTGDLRGVYFLYRGKDRKPAYYIGKRENPDEFRKIYPAFEAWRRTYRTIVGLDVGATRDVD